MTQRDYKKLRIKIVDNNILREMEKRMNRRDVLEPETSTEREFVEKAR